MTRSTCNQCLRPTSRCWCHLVCEVKSSINLWVIQHKLEVGHPKNTGLLLTRCCQRATLVDDSAVVLGNSQPSSLAFDGTPALLFPETSNTTYRPASGDSRTRPITDLIVLDANWRKAKAWVLSSEWLRSLPRLSLDSPTNAPNEIRSSTVSSARSTFVAAVEALDQIGALDSPLDEALAIYRQWQQIIINDQPPRP